MLRKNLIESGKIYISEMENSDLVFDRNTGRLFIANNKNELEVILNQIKNEPECKSVFVKTDEDVFKLNLSTTCNLNCDYCFRDKKSHIQTDVAKAKKIIDYIVDDYSPHIWMYSFSVNLTSESLVELDKIKEIKKYIDQRTSPGFSEKDFKTLEDAQRYLACFPTSLVNNFSESSDKAAIAKLLDSFLDLKNMVSYFPFPDGMELPEWEAERFRNLNNLSSYDLREFNLRFLEAIFPETILRKPHYAFYICTNGTVFSQEVVEFFKEIKLDSICISLDGPSGVHNLHRYFNDNRASHNLIVENIKKYMEAGLKVSIAAVLTKDFPYPLQLVEYFKELGVSAVGMNAVRAGTSASFDENSIDKLIKGYEILFDRLYEDVSKGDYSLVDLLKDDALFSGIKLLFSKNRIVKRCKWNENTIFDDEGNIYPCDYFIGNAKFIRGSIGSTELKDVCEGKLLVDEREKCKDCWCKYLCGGTCYYNSVKNAGDISLPDPVECKLSEGMKILSLRFIHRLLKGNVNALEFCRRIGMEFTGNVIVDKSFYVEHGISFRVMGTLTKVEMEFKKIVSQLKLMNVKFEPEMIISVLNTMETNSNKVLEMAIIVRTSEKLSDEKLKQLNCNLVENLSFGECISGEVLSKDNLVEDMKAELSRNVCNYKIPVTGLVWYEGSMDAFLGYREEKITVFMQRIKNVY